MSTEEQPIARRWVVHGRVQGVGFRYFTLRAAQQLGLAGRVRNLRDGTVEVIFRADGERSLRLERAVESGPPGSRVDKIVESEFEGEFSWHDFEIAR